MYDIQIFKIYNMIAQYLQPESEVLTGFFQLIVAGHHFADIVNGSTLQTRDIFVEIVNRSEFHSAASVRPEQLPFFDQHPSVNRREPPNPLRVVTRECHEAAPLLNAPRRTG
jgi:hypothetical protein